MSSKFKRYIVWKGATYYPGEGMYDFFHTTDSESEALVVARKSIEDDSLSWSQVFDSHEFKVIIELHHDSDGISDRPLEYLNNKINKRLMP